MCPLPSSGFPYSLFPNRQYFSNTSLHALECVDILSNSAQLLLCKFEDPLTRDAACVTCFEDLRQFRECKTDPKRPLNHKHSLNRGLRVEPVARRTPRRLGQDADLFVMSNRVRLTPTLFATVPERRLLPSLGNAMGIINPRMGSKVKLEFDPILPLNRLLRLARPMLAGKRRPAMNTTLAKALVALLPACLLLCGAVILFLRAKTAYLFMQLFGAVCMVGVILTHVCEALHLFPAMNWGAEHSAGHYLDLAGAIAALVLFPVGYVLHALFPGRHTTSDSC